MLPNGPYTVGLFINANSIIGKMTLSVSLCTYQCVCPTVSLHICVCVGVHACVVYVCGK